MKTKDFCSDDEVKLLVAAFESGQLPVAEFKSTPSAELPEPLDEEPLLEEEEQAAPAMAIPAAVTSATIVRDVLRFMRFTPSFVVWGGAVPRLREIPVAAESRPYQLRRVPWSGWRAGLPLSARDRRGLARDCL